MSDMVNHPEHYADSCSLECIEAMELAYGSDAVCWFCICNAFKYLWRYKNKNGEEDIKKAKWYYNKAKCLDEIGMYYDRITPIGKMIEKAENKS